MRRDVSDVSWAYLVDVNTINDGEVLHLLSDTRKCLRGCMMCVQEDGVRSASGSGTGRRKGKKKKGDRCRDACTSFSRAHLVHAHAGVVRVAAEAQAHDTLLLGQDCLVHGPAGPQMRQKKRHLSFPPLRAARYVKP